MSPALQDMLWIIGGVTVIALVWLAMSKSKWREELGDTGDLDPPERKAGKHPALGAGYREGPMLAFGPQEDHARDVYREFARSAGRLTRHPDERPASRARAPFKPTPAAITLTPRHLEHINILRRRDGKPLLNAAGFRNAIAQQPVPLRSSNDWTGYLIAYVILSSEHEQSRVACEHTITIQPDAPFNGQGGEFSGAGATGSFDAPVDADLGKAATQGLSYGSAGGFAAALAAGSALAGTDPGPPEPESAPEPQSALEPAPEAQPAPQPDPPSYSAPEPSYSAPDTGSTD